jgi:hypothetical protein
LGHFVLSLSKQSRRLTLIEFEGGVRSG